MMSYPSNKRLGTNFEKEFCSLLASHGYWVHFMAPDARGAQPFDVIAVKAGQALAIDCKTSVAKRFPYSRLEDNQITAFERWLRCGNEEPMIAVKYREKIYIIKYLLLKQKQYIDLEEEYLWKN